MKILCFRCLVDDHFGQKCSTCRKCGKSTDVKNCTIVCYTNAESAILITVIMLNIPKMTVRMETFIQQSMLLVHQNSPLVGKTEQ